MPLMACLIQTKTKMGAGDFLQEISGDKILHTSPYKTTT